MTFVPVTDSRVVDNLCRTTEKTSELLTLVTSDTFQTTCTLMLEHL